MNQLNEYGWNNIRQDEWKNNFETAERNYVPGRVTLEHKRMYRVVTAEGEWLSTCSGSFTHATAERRDFPAVGDWVAVEQMPGEEKGIIHSLLPRTSLFSRKVAGMAITEQIIAVNVDIVFLVTSMNDDFNARRLERYLVAAYDSGALPVVVLTKKDVCDYPEDYIDQAKQVAIGADVVAVSSKTGEGIDTLSDMLQNGKTAALLGSSGVGKSSLINALCGEARMAVQDIREDDAKGRHTTTHRELIKMPAGGILIDTPGMREFQLWNENDSVDSGFKDIESLANQCQFRNCNHHSEPGCAIQKALDEGVLEKQRYANYLKLQKELAYLERKANQKSQQGKRKTRK